MNESRLRLLAKAYRIASEYDKIPDGADYDADTLDQDILDVQEFAGRDSGSMIGEIIDEIES